MSPRVYGSCNSRYMPDGSRRYIIKVKILIYIRLAEVQITILVVISFFALVQHVRYSATQPFFSVVTQRSSALVERCVTTLKTAV